MAIAENRGGRTNRRRPERCPDGLGRAVGIDRGRPCRHRGRDSPFSASRANRRQGYGTALVSALFEADADLPPSLRRQLKRPDCHRPRLRSGNGRGTGLGAPDPVPVRPDPDFAAPVDRADLARSARSRRHQSHARPGPGFRHRQPPHHRSLPAPGWTATCTAANRWITAAAPASWRSPP